MARIPSGVWLDTPVRDIAKRMLKFDIGAVPVRANGKLVGIVSDRDIALARNGHDLRSRWITERA